jgi:CrcB protein
MAMNICSRKEPTMLTNCLWVGAGGFIGCICRYVLSLPNWPNIANLPLATLFVNVLGSFFIGALIACVLHGVLGSGSPLQLFLQVGFCGGFTTLSTFSGESLNLLERGLYFEFALYAIATFALGIIACAAGMALASHFQN